MTDMRVDLDSPTPLQCRAARAVLGWGLIEASRRTGLSIATISRCEREDASLQGTSARSVMRASYQDAGVNFVQIQDNQGLVWETPDEQARSWPSKTSSYYS